MEKRIIWLNCVCIAALYLPLVGVLLAWFQTDLPNEQRCGYFLAPKFGDQERITDPEVFGAKDFFAVAGLEIKMVYPVARRWIGLQREVERAIVEQFMHDPDSEVVA